MTDAAVSLKLPTFWSTQPRAWFIQVEAQFLLRGISSDDTKYAYIVAALDQRTAERLLDTLEAPPPVDKYQHLKNRLLETFSLNARQRASRLLSLTGLGDRGPIKLMDEMLALLGDHRPCFLFEELFRQQLPPDVRMALEYVNFSDPRAAAQMADRLFEDRSQPAVAVVQSTDAITAVNKPRRLLSKENQARRSPRQELCYFHRRFGSRAQRCSPPCNFDTNFRSCSPQGNEPAGRR